MSAFAPATPTHKLTSCAHPCSIPCFSPITSLAGIGPKVAVLIEKIVPADLGDRAARAGDLLFVLPNSVIDRRSRPGIAIAPEGAIVTLEVRIDRHQPAPRGNRVRALPRLRP
jgi:ATP-dependent DNA helicase RecG